MAKEGETKRIEALYGPFAGGMIDVPADIADQAIADGWARDPYATPDPKAQPKEWTQEGHEEMMKAADKAARKIRGEDEPKEAPKGKAADKDANADTQAAVGEARTEAMGAADADQGYETRQAKPKSPAPSPKKK